MTPFDLSSSVRSDMTNRELMPLLTELEQFNGRLVSINIALLVELADILCSASFGKDWTRASNAGKIQDPTENGA
jgi:hypothetical protein